MAVKDRTHTSKRDIRLARADLTPAGHFHNPDWLQSHIIGSHRPTILVFSQRDKTFITG
jgi:hypothetical protein